MEVELCSATCSSLVDEEREGWKRKSNDCHLLMVKENNYLDGASSVVEAARLPSSDSMSNVNSESARPCLKDNVSLEERKKIKRKEKWQIALEISSNCDVIPGTMEETDNADLVVRKKKKEKCRSEKQDDAQKCDMDFLEKMDTKKESIELAKSTDEADPTHSKKKMKEEKCSAGDPVSQKPCSGDGNTHENNVDTILQMASKPGTVKANDNTGVSMLKDKRKKGKHRLAEVQALKVAVSGTGGMKESVDLTPAKAQNCGSEEHITSGMTCERNLNGEPEPWKLCSGDGTHADGETDATHSKKRTKKKKTGSEERDDNHCREGGGISPKGPDYCEQVETPANGEIQSIHTKKRKKEKNCSEETDDKPCREGDCISPIKYPNYSKQVAELDETHAIGEIKTTRSKKRKKEKNRSEETDNKHCREGGGISHIEGSYYIKEMAEPVETQANGEMRSTRSKKRKKKRHQNIITDAQAQFWEDDNMPQKGGNAASKVSESPRKDLNECSNVTPAEGPRRERDADQHGMDQECAEIHLTNLKEKRKKKKKKRKHRSADRESERMCCRDGTVLEKGSDTISPVTEFTVERMKQHNDIITIHSPEPGNEVSECHRTETNNEDNLAPLRKRKKKDKNKSKGTEKQQICAERSNTLQNEHGADSQTVELTMEDSKQCCEKTFVTGLNLGEHDKTQTDGETSLIPLRKKKKKEKKRRKGEVSLKQASVQDSPEPHMSGIGHEENSKVEQKIETSCSHREDDFPIKSLEEKDQELNKLVDEVSPSLELSISNDPVSKGVIPNLASSKRTPVVHSRKKLLILDVNGILVHIVPFAGGDYKPDWILSRKPVFRRPFIDDFLQFCFENFSVGVWSSRTKRNLDQVINFLMGDSRRKLLFCWDQTHCTRTSFKTVENSEKPLVLKDLRKLWDKLERGLPWEKGDYNESNTLLLDDSPYKALLNPANTGIFPYSYHYMKAQDNSLGPGGDLRVYLERLALADDVQTFVKENPFGQRAITESCASWNYYARVIEEISCPAAEQACSQRIRRFMCREHPCRDTRCSHSPWREYPHQDSYGSHAPLIEYPLYETRQSPSPQTQADARHSRSSWREHPCRDDRRSLYPRPRRDTWYSHSPRREHPHRDDRRSHFPQPHQDTWHSHSPRRERLRQDNRQSGFPQPRRDTRHSRSPQREHPHPDDRWSRPPRLCRDSKHSRSSRWEHPRRYDRRSLSPHPHRDTRHSDSPLREHPHRDDRLSRSPQPCRDTRHCPSSWREHPHRNDRRSLSPRPRRDTKHSRSHCDNTLEYGQRPGC